MKAYERYLAVFDETKRKHLDRVPTFVQYVRKDFIHQHRKELRADFEGKHKVSKQWLPIMWSSRFNNSVKLGFDSNFVSTIPTVWVKPIRSTQNREKKS